MVSSFWKDKKVLLTGHSGFKGTWLLLYLIRMGAKVYGYSLPNKEDKFLFNSLHKDIEDKFIHREGNILDLKNFEKYINEVKPQIVFHLAAQALVRKSYVDPLETWNVNLIGSLNLLNSLKSIQKKCAVVIITTDKVYKNREWIYSYRENDELGGYDPYSASKAALEIAVESWRSSFIGKRSFQNPLIHLASARSGNVVGGGDWSDNRIVPDCVRALHKNKPISVRNKNSTRPWQHVLDPLRGYILLAENLYENPDQYSESFNFGPLQNGNRKVINLVEEVLKHWQGEWKDLEDQSSPHEAKLLSLDIEKAIYKLKWKPLWGFEECIEKTINWYYKFYKNQSPYQLCQNDIDDFLQSTNLIKS